MNVFDIHTIIIDVSAGCHINDVMNTTLALKSPVIVSAGCHINDVMNPDSRV